MCVFLYSFARIRTVGLAKTLPYFHNSHVTLVQNTMQNVEYKVKLIVCNVLRSMCTGHLVRC